MNLKVALEKLDAIGASIIVEVHPATIYIKDERELRALFKDPVQFMAGNFGVDRATMNRWLDWTHDEFRCGGTTKRGVQCKCFSKEQYRTPDEFRPGVTDRCSTHIQEDQ